MPSAEVPALAVFWAAAPDKKSKTAKRALKAASVLRIRFGLTAMQASVRAYAPRGTGRRREAASAVPRGETMAGLAKEAGVFRRIATGLPPASMGRKHAFVNGAFARQYKRISKNSVYDAVSRFNWIYGFTPFFMMSNTAAVVGQ